MIFNSFLALIAMTQPDFGCREYHPLPISISIDPASIAVLHSTRLSSTVTSTSTIPGGMSFVFKMPPNPSICKYPFIQAMLNVFQSSTVSSSITLGLHGMDSQIHLAFICDKEWFRNVPMNVRWWTSPQDKPFSKRLPLVEQVYNMMIWKGGKRWKYRFG